MFRVALKASLISTQQRRLRLTAGLVQFKLSFSLRVNLGLPLKVGESVGISDM